MISFICAESFLSSCAIISSIVSRTSALTRLVSASACSTRVLTAFSSFGRRALGSRLEALFQKRSKLVSIARLPLRSLRDRRCISVSVAIATLFGYGLVSRSAFALTASLSGARFFRAIISCGSAKQFAHLLFRCDFAVHVALQIRELLSRFEQLGESGNLACNGSRLKIRHLVEAQLDAHFFTGRCQRACSRPENLRRAG